jgi:large subunit ribosomal protein L3
MAIKVTGILGKKVGMTQLFDSKGDVHPVTVLQAGPCVVTQHKLAVKDGYEAAQIGLVEFVKESRLTKPARGHLAKNNLASGEVHARGAARERWRRRRSGESWRPRAGRDF